MDEQKGPLVSVIIPFFNEEDTLKRTLKGIGGQSYENVEVILVDDSSDDRSVQIAEEECEKFAKCNLMKNSCNMGKSFSNNRALMEAKGKYVIFHDADDFSLPSRISKQVNHLEDHQEVGVLGTDFFYLNKCRGESLVRHRPENDENIRSAMVKGSALNIGTAMFRYSALMETDLFQSRHVEGFEVVIQMAKNNRLANLNEPLYIYSIDSHSRSTYGPQLKKKSILAWRSFQAIHELKLGYRYLPFSLGWFIYLLVPARAKKLIRSVFSPTEENSINEKQISLLSELGFLKQNKTDE